ncbi:presequence protease, mitochondrial-like isoform X2 [Acanthaster planci]|uniref:Presequence protease, mitochondrial n=1 Tax=Acanthaster planci TaxID=133434 RepID=A0A8B8A7P1_ACAPL|nr:presequence protease, mitochondrial-like isoform X2 [Acanthaster planci]
MQRVCRFSQFTCISNTRWQTFARCKSHRLYCAASALETAEAYQPGQKMHGFTVRKVIPVPELYLTAVTLMHDVTGAKYLHVAREDSNNVFSVGFRTTPMDSTGVPHILEHTTLCGSQRYPCRDPFFKMLNRSLATFMNAWTASDYTMYPFSSQNPKDFSNLLSVYLDAAFFPRLRELDFRQEGWRLENENNQDPDSPIIFKGVVFNEMKGAMTSPEQIFALHCQNNLLPGHTYSHNSGGDPLHIPHLTWQQLKDFHATHYHPSNSRFFTYGDLPLEGHLEAIQQQALASFSPITPNTEVPNEARWTQPREKHVRCAPDPMAADPEKQTTVSVSFLLNSLTDSFEGFTMSILSHLLVSGPTSPFYQALVQANIGSDYSPVLGYDGSTKDASFSVGLQGIRQEDVEPVKSIIEDTFKKVVENGFEKERIDAVLHKIEISQKHQTTTFGLQLIASLMQSWNHDTELADVLRVNRNVDRFQACLADNPRFLQDKTEEYFLRNPHRLTLVMTPKEDYKDELDQEEKRILDSMVSELSQEDRRGIYAKGLELADEQDREEDVSVLPTLKVSDIEPELKRAKLDFKQSDGIHVQCCEQPTNGITYFRAVSTLRSVPDDLLPYIPLFCGVITRMGAADMTFHEFAQREELKTGGLGVGHHACQDPNDVLSVEQGITLTSFSLDKNLEDMFQLWSDVFNSPNLKDMDRLTTLVRMRASELAMSIPDMGHAYAMKHAGSLLSPVGRIKEICGGMAQVSFMKRIAEASDLTETMEKIRQVSGLLLNKDNLRCALNSGPEFMDDALRHLQSFLGCLPGAAQETKRPLLTKIEDFCSVSQRTHFELPFPVNYASRGVRAVSYTHADFAKLRILARLMSAKFLHREIREKGGAYGSGATLGTEGSFKFYSYRDPNSLQTLEAFDRAVEWAIEGSYSQQDIDEAKLSVFSAVDAPIAPSDKGMTLFTSHISDDMRQEQRQRMFAVSQEDLQEVAQRYLALGAQVDSLTLLGPQNTATASDKWKVFRESD